MLLKILAKIQLYIIKKIWILENISNPSLAKSFKIIAIIIDEHGQ